MPLQTGTWQANLNGTIGTLAITSVDTSGVVTGTINSNPVSGYWDEISAKLTIISGLAEQQAPAYVFYTAFLAADQFRMPGLTGGTISTLAGYYIDFKNGTADQHVFGWYAQMAQD